MYFIVSLAVHEIPIWKSEWKTRTKAQHEYYIKNNFKLLNIYRRPTKLRRRIENKRKIPTLDKRGLIALRNINQYIGPMITTARSENLPLNKFLDDIIQLEEIR